MTRRLTTLIVAAFALSLTGAATVYAAYTWAEGGTSPFNGTKTHVEDLQLGTSHNVVLQREVLGSAGALRPVFDPTTAQRLASGGTVVANPGGAEVVEFNSSGAVVWSYGTPDDPAVSQPYSAQRISGGNTLVCDRAGRSVYEITPGKTVVWRYGDGTSGSAAGQLVDPTSATRLSNGNTLICDSGGSRVIEVKTSDYNASGPDLGFTSASIVWHYGTGHPGTGTGQVRSPRQAQRLSSGSTLITDEGGHRVILVSRTGKVTWKFGGGHSGVDTAHLSSPNSALRLADGSTAIVDTGNSRVLRITKSGLVETLGAALFGANTLSQPRSISVTPENTLLLTDQGNGKILEFGYIRSGTYVTRNIDLGTPGVKKWITRIEVKASVPDKTGVRMEYAYDGGHYVHAAGRVLKYPKGRKATFVRLKLNLTTADRNVTPKVTAITVTYSLTDPKAGTAGSTTTTSTLSTGVPLTLNFPSSVSSGTPGVVATATAIPVDPTTVLHNGFLMQQTAGSGSELSGSPSKLGIIDVAGGIAATLLLGTFYGLGLASPVLARTTHTGLVAARSLITRSFNG
jgi:hypothetical protein